MWEFIGSVLKIAIFLMTWRRDITKENKEKKALLAKEVSDAIKSGSISRINAAAQSVRMFCS